MTISTVVVGVPEAVAKFGRMSDAARSTTRTLLEEIARDFIEHVKTTKFSGNPLQSRSGKLRDSLKYQITESGSETSAVVSTDVPYAAIQEYGGRTRAHVILPRTAQALHFLIGGKDVFAKRVNHPGSILPERSYLRSSLEEMQPEIVSRLGALVQRLKEA